MCVGNVGMLHLDFFIVVVISVVLLDNKIHV